MIELRNITKIYRPNKSERVIALDSINLSIKEGELVVLKGASGSGKSTILSLIAALSKPTSGDVIVDSDYVSKLSDDFAALYRRLDVGFVFQRYNLLANLTVEENILLPLVPSNLDKDELQKSLKRVLEHYHIAHKRTQKVKNLSGGEQQRVAIARANINNPKIILADEPTANLDRALLGHFIDILEKLRAEKKTIIVATHDPIFFDLEFVDRVITIDRGEIIR